MAPNNLFKLCTVRIRVKDRVMVMVKVKDRVRVGVKVA